MKKKICFLMPTLIGGGADKGVINLINLLPEERYEVRLYCRYPTGFLRIKEITRKVHFTCFAAGAGLVFGKKSMLPKKNSEPRHALAIFKPSIFRNTFTYGHNDIEFLFVDGLDWRAVSAAPASCRKLLRLSNNPAKENAWALYRDVEGTKRHEELYSVADAIIFPSLNTRDTFAALHGSIKKLHCIYNVNPRTELEILSKKPMKQKIHRERLTLCASGRLELQKGYDRLLRICRRLMDGGLSFDVWILGRGALQGNLIALAEELNLDNIHFLGYQENPFPYLRAADVFVSSSHYEGLSNSAKEALLLGLPCVVADCEGMKEIFGQNSEYGLVTAPDDQSLYEGIQRMICCPQLREYYRKMAALRWEHFSPERSLKCYEALFNGGS